MRRAAVLSALLLLASAAVAAPQRRAAPPVQNPAPGGPPHAWLFGTWTGGLFPVLDGMLAQDCKAQQTVVFGRDTLAHASLLTNGASERVIETVRATATGAEFRLAPAAADAGFGCDDPNTLHVARQDINTISFPSCAAFPYQLSRCPST